MDDVVSKENSSIVFKLPLPPTVNRMYMRTKRAVVLTKEARQYKWDVEVEMRRLKPPKFDDSAIIGFGMAVYPSDGREALRDVDNGVKIVLDAFQSAGLYKNDRQVKEMHVKMMPLNRLSRRVSAGYVIVTFYNLCI